MDMIILQRSGLGTIRNKQAGDWCYGDHFIFSQALKSIPSDSQFAVAIHEAVEAYLCRRSGVTDAEVCAFDEKYEAERDQGKHAEESEPGDDPNAPYREQHMMATHVEKAVCLALGLNWKDHCASITK